MSERVIFHTANPEAVQAMLAISNYVANCSIEHSLAELVKIRASQINGCANCLHMHTADARKAGETEARIYLLSAWRESLLYTPRERAALAWTESLTLIAQSHAPDEDYQALQAAFTPKEQVDLTVLINVINSWNRLAVGFRTVHPSDRKGAALKVA
ncbi:alkylhydroperoxidase AhpD family core domain-containing protein [Kaistia soli DSM 19436]|uniref:Alkylhydroperoxidase AhpD family core domain-containing protein n=1 Tax=Kaistia soli DSM 19436 TaxID=1122133 RepID=A0A1M4X7X8_9HYPH|nr:carboxymuconolactone decarboxylase family protein [Kaistia soli]SHE89608.1 alkylhydroperoxidase AhpD family core domain-containing protein [Kaistia soli DSM 19436]